ncbi:MAG: SCO family protein [Leptospirales bacterium]|nr:SCO family protein [Leptospirales bacterium]
MKRQTSPNPGPRALILTALLCSLLYSGCGPLLPDLGAAPELAFGAASSSSGAPLRIPDPEATATLVYFGYTSCPDFCPQTLSKIRRAVNSLGRRGRGVRTILISVDPERDSPELLRRYLEGFGLQAAGVSPETAALRDAAHAFAVDFRRVESPESALRYTVDHSTRLFVIDARGRLRARLSAESSAADLVELLDRLLPAF